jgi:hypothetical protein
MNGNKSPKNKQLILSLLLSRMQNKNMASVRKFSLAFRLVAIGNETLELCIQIDHKP